MTQLNFSKLCLASQSPRRKELLTQIGVDFEVMPAHIDETVAKAESPETYVERMTFQKAQAVWSSTQYHGRFPVLASDTAVIQHDSILGKPENKADGDRMLSMLSGQTHQVMSGVGLLFEDRFDYRLSVSHVTFRALTQADIDNYWRTQEGVDKAGCYAIQGFAASFIQHMSGSFSGVMGLPIYETSELLSNWGIAFWPQRVTA